MATPPFIDMLSRLVATPSISSADPNLDTSNRAVIDQLAAWLEDAGFSIEIQPLADAKANLVATRGSGENGLVLAGHTDTVPCNESRWDSSPFELSDRDNRFYGLGSTDMKGFFAVALEAIRAFDGVDFQHPLIVLATADEESSMSGARALSREQFNARYAVIGEPTGLKPVRMHKGVIMETIALRGQSGHSSNPALGRNALDAMHKVIAELINLRDDWGRRYQDSAFEVAVPTLNLATIHGGDAPNRICSHCELSFDVRLMPGMPADAIREEIRQRCDSALQGTGIRADTRSLFEGVEAFCEPEHSELLQTVSQLTGHSAGNVGFATEAPFLQAMGMQTVVMGPGSIDCAHQANEYLPQDQIKPGIELLKSLIQRYCL